MGLRRIIMDSDDDIDDFPSLRPSLPTSTSTATGKPARQAEAQAKAPARTPKPLRLQADAAAAASNTTVRRRRLGKINNDASLFRPWEDSKHNIPGCQPHRFMSPQVGLPHNTSPNPKRPKSSMELRTRRTRRVSELPAGDAGDLSTEEAAVLENVTLEGDHDEVESKNATSNDQHKDEQHCKQDDDEQGDSDSEASEFQDTLADSDSSLDSLGDFFSRPPTRRFAAKQSTTRQSLKENDAPGSHSQSALSICTDEGSSVFFSAEESLSDLCARPTSQARLIGPSSKTTTQSLATDPAPPAHSDGPKTATPGLPAKSQAARLQSPTKKLPRIPLTPHRPSMDDFWNQMVVDDWNTEHSPRKLLFDPGDVNKTNRSPEKATAAIATSSLLKKGTTAVTRERDAKKLFQKAKHSMAEKFLGELDSTITNGELGRLAAATGGVRIEWTNKLNTTAGRANWRRETLRSKKGTPTTNIEDDSVTDTSATAVASRVHHHASIELAEKVIDDEHRLFNVIAHEFCHLANFMVSGITGNPHGKEFKAWAVQCSRHFGDRGIQVTTKHAYEIDFKYVWMCEECATEFKRHSKSIDPARHRCGACKGVLKQTKPVPRGGGARNSSKAGTSGSTATSGPSEYQKFMKEHMAAVRRQNPNSPQKVIMTLVADKWTKAKEQKKDARSLAAEIQSEVEVGNVKGSETCVNHLGKAFVDLTLQ